MTSSEWVTVIIALYGHINGLATFIYPVYWSLKIVKRVLGLGL